MHISEADLALVRRVLAQYLPPEVSVMAYGSRVTGRNLKPFSDLDLCLSAGASMLPDGVIAQLRQAFEDADLPFRVDVVDRGQCDAAFLAVIDRDCVPLSGAEASA
jgi:predicted nucleotidyltransferase